MKNLFTTRKPFMFHSPGWLDWVRAQSDNQVQALPTGHWVMLHKPDAIPRCAADWLGAPDQSR